MSTLQKEILCTLWLGLGLRISCSLFHSRFPPLPMQQPYSNYPPYYGQPMYPHTPYMGPTSPTSPPGPSSGYPPFYGPQQPAPAPPTGNLPAPAPYSFDAAAYAVKPGHPIGQPATSRRHRRNQTTPTTQPAPTAPLKSAMKKTMNVFNVAENTLGRQFSNPFSHSQQNPAPQFPRPRVQSNPSRSQNATKEPSHEQDQPTCKLRLLRALIGISLVLKSVHMFLSFHNLNELRIEYIMQMGLEEMRKVIWPLWPDGIESDTITGHTCVVKFRNTPWDLNGPNVRECVFFIQIRAYIIQISSYASNLGPTGLSLKYLLSFRNGCVALSVRLPQDFI